MTEDSFYLGFIIGAAVMYFYIHIAGLFRTREEYYKAKEKKK